MLFRSCGALPYVGALAWANGWLSGTWSGWEQVRESLGAVRWMPLYYHYFSTEMTALVSLLYCVLMYAPVGAACVAWGLRADASVRGSAWTPALLAGCVALVMEAGKLAMPERHPDPSNVLIAMVAAALVWAGPQSPSTLWWAMGLSALGLALTALIPPLPAAHDTQIGRAHV